MDAAAIISAIGRIKDNKWPRPWKTDPTQRDPNQICKYHGRHGHRTEDCRQLREEVARLFNDGHLREFQSDRAKNHFRNRYSNKENGQYEYQHVIHMIIEGFDVPQCPMMKCTKVSITREKQTRDYLPEGTLSFNGEDTEGIMQPHNDALVLKFPTPDGTKTVYGEQPTAKEMFVVDEVVPISALSSTKDSSSKAKQEAK
ncbi:PREDICTED: uncharacterized protein LOC109206094 [Nicotiana attenuata]|uniref:uncharacterized protein LOC109206094 n=1 Tax=Nicotiana attenuata TaxID=49451 RepID=UPI0009050CAE|nr:PREDICTED: uncharacterized protein LOC109206094 [Nicotiana attenuata]